MIAVYTSPSAQIFWELVVKYEYDYCRIVPLNLDFIPERSEIVLPIDGRIEIDRALLYMISIPIVHRLSKIKQLALTYLIYQGATHTRLEHSLGVANKIRVFLEVIKDKVSKYNVKILNLNDLDILIAQLGGLLHDVGHSGWGHALDGITGDLVSHLLELGVGLKYLPAHPRKLDIILLLYLIYNNDQLRNALETIAKQINFWCNLDFRRNPEIFLDVVSAIVIEEERLDSFKSLLNNQCALRKIRLFQNLLGGSINCDRLDWLLRDCYHAVLLKENEIYDLQEALSLSKLRDNIDVSISNNHVNVTLPQNIRERIDYIREKLYTNIYESLPRAFIDAFLTRIAYVVLKVLYYVGKKISAPSTIAKVLVGYLLLDDESLRYYSQRIVDTILRELQYYIEDVTVREFIERTRFISENLEYIRPLLSILHRAGNEVKSTKISSNVFIHYLVNLPLINTILYLDIFSILQIFSKYYEMYEKEDYLFLERICDFLNTARISPMGTLEIISLENELNRRFKSEGVVELQVLVNYYAFRRLTDSIEQYIKRIEKRPKTFKELFNNLIAEKEVKETGKYISILFIISKSDISEKVIEDIGRYVYERLQGIVDGYIRGRLT